MEVYAVYNWKVSPYNGDLNPDEEDITNHVFLQVLLDPELSVKAVLDKKLHTKTEMDKYILCSFPFSAIQSIFPHDTIEVSAENQDGGIEKSTMIINKIIINDDIRGKIVKSKKEGDISVFDKSFSIESTTLTQMGVIDWLKDKHDIGEDVQFGNINCSVSRDPPSCRG